MAQSNQNVSISLTLPISCQICLGKVRHPVICGNFHVFCSACMEVWLKKASQCPTCRTPITPENPCREIIGATNEGECNDNYSVKKKLRKTRSELLLREYEDEIDGLQNENEELRSKNLSLEEQLKTVLGPSSSVSDKSENVNQQSEDGKIDPHFIEEWTKRLAVATELQKELQVEIEKLKEANKTLRAQNVDLVRENSYLKAEVESRSPQKFGRYTVAALEAKISQYERDVKHLQKALERSDKYIEELEARVSESQTGFDKTAAVKHPGYVLWEMMDEVSTANYQPSPPPSPARATSRERSREEKQDREGRGAQVYRRCSHLGQ
ncbi:RING finger protein 219 [Arapaima gigas]